MGDEERGESGFSPDFADQNFSLEVKPSLVTSRETIPASPIPDTILFKGEHHEYRPLDRKIVKVKGVEKFGPAGGISPTGLGIQLSASAIASLK